MTVTRDENILSKGISVNHAITTIGKFRNLVIFFLIQQQKDGRDKSFLLVFGAIQCFISI